MTVLADGAYGRGDLWERVRDDLGCALDVAERPAGATTFVVQRARWIVEQSIACLGRDRRLAKDYEYTNSSSKARVLIAAIGRSLHRLAPGPAQRQGLRPIRRLAKVLSFGAYYSLNTL